MGFADIDSVVRHKGRVQFCAYKHLLVIAKKYRTW